MSNWIPCSERLPDFGQQVLTFRPNDPVHIYFVSRVLCIGQPLVEQWYWHESDDVAYRAEKMTHWHPVPEKP